MDINQHNSQAWDQKVSDQSVYTLAVSAEEVAKARKGEWQIGVTAGKPVPREWFPPELFGKKILCLASGGGQQAPILAAAGAEVTVADISEKQLEQDRFVAKRDQLSFEIVQGSMTDLSQFADESFDIVVHPVANLFVADIKIVWQEIARVLKPQGILIAGFTNPLLYIFDEAAEEKGELVVKNVIPGNSLDWLPENQRGDYLASGQTIEFAHTLEDQIQGQLAAGFVLTDFYEDDFGGSRPLDKYIKCFAATRAVKLSI